MRLGLSIGYWNSAAEDHVPLCRVAEASGFHSVWTAEAYGSDAVSPLVWLAAHTSQIELGTAVMQMPARTPANTAMTAATVDLLSAGRFRLGLGASGPQVVEGWHGVAYGRPLARTRDYVAIVRAALKREGRLQHEGEELSVPFTGAGSTGLGKPLKMILHPLRDRIPVYLAALGPRNVALAAEVADGWLPVFYSPRHSKEVFGGALREGLVAGGTAELDVAPTVPVVMGADLAACRDQLRPGIALYVGGMGARGRNFYNDLACRYGFSAAAATIQELYLSGHVPEAIAAVPDELVDSVALVGPAARIRDELEAWRDAGVTTLICATTDVDTVRTLADLCA